MKKLFFMLLLVTNAATASDDCSIHSKYLEQHGNKLFFSHTLENGKVLIPTSKFNILDRFYFIPLDSGKIYSLDTPQIINSSYQGAETCNSERLEASLPYNNNNIVPWSAGLLFFSKQGHSNIKWIPAKPSQCTRSKDICNTSLSMENKTIGRECYVAEADSLKFIWKNWMDLLPKELKKDSYASERECANHNDNPEKCMRNTISYLEIIDNPTSACFKTDFIYTSSTHLIREGLFFQTLALSKNSESFHSWPWINLQKFLGVLTIDSQETWLLFDSGANSYPSGYFAIQISNSKPYNIINFEFIFMFVV